MTRPDCLRLSVAVATSIQLCKYYDNIKKRCLNGEKVSYSDLDVLNLRQCFREFSLEAYPELVALVWPEYARPEVNPDNV